MSVEVASDRGLAPCRRANPAAKADNHLRAFIDGKHRDAENADPNEAVKPEKLNDSCNLVSCIQAARSHTSNVVKDFNPFFPSPGGPHRDQQASTGSIPAIDHKSGRMIPGKQNDKGVSDEIYH
jgi:hypothetical protein